MTKHNKSNYSVPYFKVRHVPVQIDLHPPEPGAVPGDEEDVPRQRLPLLVGVVQVLIVQVLPEVLHLGSRTGEFRKAGRLSDERFFIVIALFLKRQETL